MLTRAWHGAPPVLQHKGLKLKVPDPTQGISRRTV
jgi:hypothetical protein